MQRLRHTIAAVAVAVLAAAGCGAGDPIPANTAASIATLRALERRVRALPDKVDSETRSTTEAGVARLTELVSASRSRSPSRSPSR